MTLAPAPPTRTYWAGAGRAHARPAGCWGSRAAAICCAAARGSRQIRVLWLRVTWSVESKQRRGGSSGQERRRQRRPEQLQLSGSFRRSFCRGLVTAPIFPALSVVVWAGECLPLLPPPFAGPPSPHPGFSWWLLRLWRTAAAVAERGFFSGSESPRPGWRLCTWRSPLLPSPRPPAKSEAESLKFGFLCRKPESGLGREVDGSHGWFYF